MATKRAPATPASPSPTPARPPYMLIEQIQVKGYKSLVDATLHVRPLTLLAGTNSSGKSSIMQPLLLIKQTMEAPYQPAGALVLNGAHVQAETAGELVSKVADNMTNQIQIAIRGISAFGGNDVQPFKNDIELTYQRQGLAFELINQKAKGSDSLFELNPGSIWPEIEPQLEGGIREILTQSKNTIIPRVKKGFIELRFETEESSQSLVFSFFIEICLGSLFHVPGLRGAPRRSYAATFFQNQIKGTFDLYAAGTISQWQQQENTTALAQLNNYLRRLGLTDTVTAKVKNANEVELSVSRLPPGIKGKPRKADMVNIADMGIGVSQVLPILVALIAAQEGQLVYVEQPELHLHPRAQVAMAELLAEAANRGVRVIVETHSSLLLLTVQTMVAEGRIKPADVGLHWFERDAKGATKVTLAEVDENGAYGNWPEDFGDVELAAQMAFLNAKTDRQPFLSTKNEK